MRKHIVKALERMADWARSRGSAEDQNSDVPVLLPLTPKYDPEKHGVYFDVIEAALTNNEHRIKNIALTGSYGVGKSSILEEVADRHRKDIISVSLSTLGFPDDEPVPAGTAAKAAATKTNRIQKEILKQLLYSQDPVKTPGSRYRRTTRFRFRRALGLAVMLAVPVTLMFFLTGWTTSIETLVVLPTDFHLAVHAIVLVASAALFLGFLAMFHNRFQIDALNAGAATISLSAKSATYFDEYLDEIVYFFEAVKRNIVIFEDIDRFDDAHIFETLRSLNGILNGAKQLKGRRIQFIYAIKDSIFDELGTRAAKEEIPAGGLETPSPAVAEKRKLDAAEAEIARANRTKFFDLVVPVVPFITHRSARDLLVTTLSDLDNDVSDEVIDLAARHVADMRLIKNIRNEFAIFKRQIIEKGNLELSQDGLFAMVLYKSTHLADFERIKLGRSNLDTLYGDGRRLVSVNIKSLNAQIRQARLLRPKVTISANQSKPLGAALAAHIARTFRHLGLGDTRIQSQTMNGEAFDDAGLQSPKFWETLATTNGTLEVGYYQVNYGRHESVTFTRVDIAEALRQPIESATWIVSEQKRLDNQIANAITNRDFLAHADMSELMERDEFTIDWGGQERSFAAIANARLESALAVQLLAAGYIDRNFTLYTSTFYTERVSANATNFILKNVDPNVIDMYFALDADDAEAILRERGRSILREKSVFNINFLDYLLDQDPDGVRIMVGMLLKSGGDELDLLLAYLESGEHRDRLIRAMAPRWSKILIFLVTGAQLDDAVRVQLVAVALRTASADIEYEVDDELRDYLTASYESLTVFTTADTPETTAAIVAGILRKADAKLPSLSLLAANMSKAVVGVGAYSVNRENLLSALGDTEHDLSLDGIAKLKDWVYRRTLADLPAYLDSLGESALTVIDPAAFVSIIEDVLEADDTQLAAIIERAATACIVPRLSDVSTAAWIRLADARRFPATFSNVHAYVEDMGVDSHIAAVLTEAHAVEVDLGTDEASKLEIALKILRAKDQLPSARLRAELVGSLALLTYLWVFSERLNGRTPLSA